MISMSWFRKTKQVDRGDQEHRGHAGERDPQVLQVLQKGLFGFVVRVLAELEDFFEEVHAGAGACVACLPGLGN